jgi:preprotein translocase subunit YajC
MAAVPLARAQFRRKLPHGPQIGLLAGSVRRIAIGAATVIVRAVFGRDVRAERQVQRGRSMLITPAFAQAAGGETGNMLVSLLPFILIFVIMYFLILRPQQKRVKQHQEMVKNVRRGDTVVTSGGLIGKVTKVIDDDQIEVEVAEGVRIRQVRQMITDVRAKGEPVKGESAKDEG